MVTPVMAEMSEFDEHYLTKVSEKYERSLETDLDGVCSSKDSDGNCDDAVFLEALLQFEKDSMCFPIVSDIEINHEVRLARPQKTKKQTSWCMNVWSAWRTSRLDRAKCANEKPPRLLDMDDEALCKWIGRFVFEARKLNGTEYTGESLYQLICGLQRYLRENGRPEVDFFQIVSTVVCVVLLIVE